MTPGPGPRWHKDPVVAAGAAIAIALHAWVFFAAEYLPYFDWANHLGLISVMAHGEETGALAYMERSWAPTPYLLFYAVSSGFAQFMSVPAAAKASLLVATGLCTYGGAFCAERFGRSPRLGIVTPLVLFGFSLGYGFASFVFAIPWLFFLLGTTEGVLQSAVGAPSITTKRWWAASASVLVFLFLGHALLFGCAALLLGVRTTCWALSMARKTPRGAARGWLLVASTSLPAVCIGLPGLLMRWPSPEQMTAQAAKAEHLFTFVPLENHLSSLAGHLLDRGSADHAHTMYGVAALFCGLVILSLIRRHPQRTGFGLEIYAGLLAALYLFGPKGLNKPFDVWLIYPRFGVIAAAVILLLPRPDLRSWRALPAGIVALGLLTHNAFLNHGHIEQFGGWAQNYDPVRAIIPPGSRVLGLTMAPKGDLTKNHHALKSLYFYHLVDGAAYSAFLFDNPFVPVRPKKAGRPRAPHWASTRTFNPWVHGKDFDYLVLRGPGLTKRADASRNHDRVETLNGWTVYKTKNPTPMRR